MEFFIPDISPEDAEEAYASYATLAGGAPQPHGRRIRSISWRPRTDELWTAEVGKKLSGKKDVVKGRGTTRREYTESLHDGATVLAIFPGVPYRVVTDKKINPEVRSAWENPFLASANPVSVMTFDVAKEAGK
ncbi:hypothetical protein FJ661_20040 [Pseudarthrobacter phenanthrenivorans]|uniref:hypothetical protein n=1 Tax=Pseudarthrobacter phenanthrenivorans TaxID=361575 RepID=UPI00112D874D|nr:hypothetical protein [Pseudarthrobacter phenanthrenivorans]TPV47811.1 hypothetical protein FJ661_20040 [Pseudarthrobacter phenanthrenivorans]